MSSYSHATLVCTQWDNQPNKTNSSCGLLVGGVVQAITVDSYAAGLAASQHGLSGGGGPDTQITSYFDCELTGGCGNTHDEGRDTDTLQDEAFFLAEGWDLTTVWGFDGVHTYPCLRWEASCGGGPVCETNDTSCDGIDDDCDGTNDEDFVSTSVDCGVGACVASGAVLCVSGGEVDNCTPGTPAADDSTCDGIDDDCDGLIDEEFVGTSTACGSGACSGTGTTVCENGLTIDTCEAGTGTFDDATCDGVDNDCDGVEDEDYLSVATDCGVGACVASGATSCVAGSEIDSCDPGVPADDDSTCDGIDDDCDGIIDGDYVESLTSCGAGACVADGVLSCIDGAEVDSCDPGVSAADDNTCDGVDNNCNGTVDEGYVSTSTTCGQGACNANGATNCAAGIETDSCSPGTPAANDALCDGIDNDCDGAIDEEFTPTNTNCGVGACGSTGTTSCTAGTETDGCAPGVPAPSDSSCDGVDNDCNGGIDDGYLPSPTVCGVGACGAFGTTSCTAGAEADSCLPGTPAAQDATCNGIDDDCDGMNDEDHFEEVTSCGIGACAALGVLSCLNGAIANTCTPGPATGDDSLCDGIDNDCDASVDEDFARSCNGTQAVACIAGALDNTECDDADLCTGTETCNAGSCQPGTPPITDDGNPCTTDSCDPLTGVQHVAAPTGTSCDDDTDACNGGGACDETGACIAAESIDTSDGNPCTIDTCDSEGGVVHTPAPAGAPCNDWDLCNGIETCDSAGACLPGTPPTSGACFTDGPTAAFSTSEGLNIVNLDEGTTLVSHDGSVPFMSYGTGVGVLNWSTGNANQSIVFDLRDGIQVIDRVQLNGRPDTRGPRNIEVAVSTTGTAETDFTTVLQAELALQGGLQVFSFAPSAARFVRFTVVTNWGHHSETGLQNLSLWTRNHPGGAVGIWQLGASVADASYIPFAEHLFCENETHTWTGLSNTNEFVTIDLQGDAPVVVDRVRFRTQNTTESPRDVEVWVSSAGIAAADFTRVLVDTVQKTNGVQWFFFDPIEARYVKLVALNNYGAAKTKVIKFWPYSPFVGDPIVPFDDISTPGTSNIVRWEWDFGDGNRSLLQHPEHEYAEAGEYLVTLRVVDENGLHDTAQQRFTAFAPPVPDFSWTPESAFQKVQIDVTDTSTPGDAPLTGVFFEGTQISGGGINSIRTPGSTVWVSNDDAGPLALTLTAYDRNQLSRSITQPIPFHNIAPILTGEQDVTVFWGEVWDLGYDWDLQDDAGFSYNLTCTWDFGDGQTAHVGPPCRYGQTAGDLNETIDLRVPHSYDEPGIYRPTLTASDPQGGATTVSFNVTVTKRQSALVLQPLPGPVDGPTTVTAILSDASEPNTRMANKSVRFTLRNQDITVTTDVDGTAEVTLDLINGDNEISVEFIGNDDYLASSDLKSLPQVIEPPGPDQCGKEFVVKFNRNFYNSSDAGGVALVEPVYGRNTVTLSSKIDMTVKVLSPPLGIDLLVRTPPGQVVEVPLPLRARDTAPGQIDLNVIRIEAPQEVCVQAHNYNFAGSESFLALPIDVLGTEYVVAAFNQFLTTFHGSMNAQFSVVATEDNTSITIVPTAPLVAVHSPDGSFFDPSAGVPFTIVLNANQAMLFESIGNNLIHRPTGTRITSTAPIAVTGGHRCAQVPKGFDACDHLVEQLPPIETLGTHFLVAPFAERQSGYMLQVVAHADNTVVTVNGTVAATLQASEFFELDVDSTDPNEAYLEVNTSKSALVTQFAKSQQTDSAVGDPSMTLVIPTEQFLADFAVRTITDYYRPPAFINNDPRDTAFDNYLNIIAKNTDIGGVRVDGAPVSAAFVPIGASGYSAAQVSITPGEHHITHVLKTTPLGVYVYGWEDFESYAYPANMRLVPLANGCTPTTSVPGDARDNDCDGRVDEELGNGIDDDGDGLVDEDLAFESGPAVNVPPVAFAQQGVTLEDTNGSFVLSGFDANGDALTFAISTPPNNGTLSLSGNVVTYTPRGKLQRQRLV